LGDVANQKIPESVHEGGSLFGEKILVMGGTEPGHSTDAVACLIADWVGADTFINASNVDAVYDKNPNVHDDAVALKSVHIDRLSDILSGEGFNAGEYPLLDHVALSVIKRSRIKTLFVGGRDLQNMRKAANGEDFRGTTVIF
jgi:uridylate kinase